MTCLYIILATYTTHILVLIMYDSICVYIQILLDMPNVTPVRVFQMECALLEALQNKKTRRDIFRDFLGKCMYTVYCTVYVMYCQYTYFSVCIGILYMN